MFKLKTLLIIGFLVASAGTVGFFYFQERLPFFAKPEQPEAGIIEGSLSYPSEGIPDNVEACAESVTSFQEYCTTDRVEGGQYRYGIGYELEVPPGSYEVYAYRPDMPDFRAYYTEGEEKKVVEVEKGERVGGVDLLGWENFSQLEEVNFSERGNLIRNAPGLEEDIWYLSYEKPGSPGLKVELSFGTDECTTPEGEPCDELLSDELIGKRVEVTGVKKGETVRVRSLKFVAEGVSEMERLRQKARVWIENNSPTYRFDGADLEFVEERGLDLVGCENCYEFEFEFLSSQAGYGNREDKIVAQVITPHTIVVRIENGEVVSVVTDGKFDEMAGELIES